MSPPHTSASKLLGQWRRKKSTVLFKFLILVERFYKGWVAYRGSVAYRGMGGSEKDGSLIL
jgi:hypothetical protein